MKRLILLLCSLVMASGTFGAAEEYPLGPDSQRQPGVPQGAVTHYTWTTSKVYPGTFRDYWVYVPAQYTPAKPACVMVFEDGESFIKEDGRARIPIVFDNLIAKHDMPVTIGILINPGVLKAPSPGQKDRPNRSFEYDTLGNRYARFLLDEILPEVAKQYKLSADPNDRAISGISSGGICSFNVAWNRPDAFRRVLSFVGSFADLRGGDIYPALIRKTEPKPLRVFLQDGNKDLNIFGGDWWLANQAMFSALEWAGYDAKFVTGDMDHDMEQGGAILPDALRWLWRDYPQPIAQSHSGHDARFGPPILDPASDWEPVGAPPTPRLSKVFDDGFNWIIGTWDSERVSAAGLATDTAGNIFFSETPGQRITKVAATGQVSPFYKYPRGSNQASRGLTFGADGLLYACEGDRIMAYAPQAKRQIIAKGIECQDLAVARNGGIYFTDPQGYGVWYVDRTGRKRKEDLPMFSKFTGGPIGICLSPDQSFLIVDGPDLRWVWSFQVQADGSLGNAEPFYRLESRDDSSRTGAAEMAMDSLGYLYVATRLGIQVCDLEGRVQTIINSPAPGPLRAVAFGGPDLQDLYVVAQDKLFKRHLLRKGVASQTANGK
jgi:enterochelin esterase-like enzyme/sugar lactone lactonase YvrE